MRHVFTHTNLFKNTPTKILATITLLYSLITIFAIYKFIYCILYLKQTLNIVAHFQSIAQVAADKNFFVRMAANLLIRRYKSQPIVQMTAKEFMFGYETELTTMGNTLTPNWITFSKVGLIDRV